MAFETRLPKICWHRVASVTTTISGALGTRFPVELFALGDRGKLTVDLVDQCSDRERAETEWSRSLDDPRVVEVAARQAQEIVAKGNHREQVPALIRCDGRRRVAQEQVKPGPERDQRAAELVAQSWTRWI